MRRAEVDNLERVGINAFAQTDELLIGEWVAVIGASPARRANAIYPIGDPGRSVASAIATAGSFLTSHDRPVLYKLAVPAGQTHDLEPQLSGLGFLPEGLTEVLTADRMPRRMGAHEAAVVIEEGLSDTWLADRARILALSRPQVERFAASVGQLDRPEAFASTTGTGSAQGRAVMMGAWMGIFDMLTEPAARRQGLGREVLWSLLAWGVARGADRVFLQAEVGNEPAQSLYSSAGFGRAYRYSYWRAAESSRPR